MKTIRSLASAAKKLYNVAMRLVAEERAHHDAYLCDSCEALKDRILVDMKILSSRKVDLGDDKCDYWGEGCNSSFEEDAIARHEVKYVCDGVPGECAIASSWFSKGEPPCDPVKPSGTRESSGQPSQGLSSF